jgi:pimeloyl-ACP methyl ester carboxylesterase
MPFANNQGIRIHYQTEGKGQPLVLQHWSFSSLDDWYDCGYVAALKDDYRLVLLDARGFGGSDKPHDPKAYGLDRRVGDIVAVLDDLGIAQTHYFGYSMGGWIGFGAAHYAPDRFRSLIIGGQHPYAQKLDDGRALLSTGIEHGAEAFIDLWEQKEGALPPGLRNRFRTFDFQALWTLAQDRASLEVVLPTMKMPCLLIVGGADDICGLVQKCAPQIPKGKLIILPGLDHGQCIERSDLLAPHIKAFLQTVS